MILESSLDSKIFGREPSIFLLINWTYSLACIILAVSVKTVGLQSGSTTTRLRTFRLRHFVYRHLVYRHFVYYCIPACRRVIHPTSVSANHYFHQFQLPLTL